MKRLFSMWLVMVAALFANSGNIAVTKGEVYVERGTSKVAATDGISLQTGDKIRTVGASKAQLIFPDDTVVTVGRDSRLELAAFRYEKQKAGESQVRLLLLEGSMKVISGKAAKAAPESFHIETLRSKIGVEGTHLLVSVGNDQDTVLCTEGKIRVADKATGGSVAVAAGKVTFVSGGEAPQEPRSYKTAELNKIITRVFSNVGSVVVSQGNVLLHRGKRQTNAPQGTLVEQSDVIETLGNGSRAQIVFNDQTIISIGQESRFEIKSYAIDEVEGDKSDVSFSVVKGAFKALSGRIGAINPQGFKLETRTATIGIRGTNFLGQIGQKNDAIVCTKGEIIVTSLAGGAPVSVSAGKITYVGQGEQPTTPRAYTADEIGGIFNAVENIDQDKGDGQGAPGLQGTTATSGSSGGEDRSRLEQIEDVINMVTEEGDKQEYPEAYPVIDTPEETQTYDEQADDVTQDAHEGDMKGTIGDEPELPGTVSGPDTDEPAAEEPGTDIPEVNEPETEEPGAEEPAVEDPTDTDKPGAIPADPNEPGEPATPAVPPGTDPEPDVDPDPVVNPEPEHDPTDTDKPGAIPADPNEPGEPATPAVPPSDGGDKEHPGDQGHHYGQEKDHDNNGQKVGHDRD